MIAEYAPNVAGPELLGLFEGYPKSDIVNFLASMNAAGWDKAKWRNVSDQLFYAYTEAVQKKGFPRWEPSNASNAARTIDYVRKATGVPQDQTYAYILGLYTMMKMGKLDPKYWNPKTGGALQDYGVSQTVKSIARSLKPAAAVTSPATEGARKAMMALLIAAGITVVGAVAAKSYVNKKVI